MTAAIDKLQQLDDDELDALIELAQARANSAMSKREFLKAAGVLGTGAVLGGGATSQMTQDAQAAASTVDGDGDIGTPANPEDVFADALAVFDGANNQIGSFDETGIETPSVNTENVNSVRYAPSGATDSEIQTLINDVSTAVPDGATGVVYGRPDDTVTLSSTLTIPSNVYLINFKFRQADGANLPAMVRSDGFTGLVGNDIWFVSGGIRYNLGLINCHLDGNKSNNTSGRGIELYAKQTTLKNVRVINCPDEGIYSEAGTAVGQNDWRDMPETWVSNLKVRNCGSHGVQWRGPHDAVLNYLISAVNGGNNLLIEADGATYNGACDIEYAHVYSSALAGIKTTATLEASYLESESNNGMGLDLGAEATIGAYKAFGNGDTDLYMNSPDIRVNAVDIRANNGTSIKYNDIRCSVKNAILSGDGTAQTAVDIDANISAFDGVINAYSGSGGTAISLATNGSVNSCRVSGAVLDSDTLLQYPNGGTKNQVALAGFAASGQTAFTGGKPANNDNFWVEITGSDEAHSETKGSVSISDGGTITHNLLATPDVEDITVQTSSSNRAYVKSVSASDVTVGIDDPSGASVGTAETVYWSAKL